MSGNRGAGTGVLAVDGGGGVEWGAIPEAPAIAETIYVGRASFHMEVEHETGQTAAAVLVVPAPAPTVDSGAWFRETPAPAHERTAIIDFSSRLHGSGPNGVPVALDGAGGFGSRGLISSRWSLGLPLLFGAFFCGLLLSPLAASSFSGAKGAKGTNVPAAPPTTVTTSHAPSLAPSVAPPAPPAAPAVPVIAPITPMAPIDPTRAHHSNLVADIFSGRSTRAALAPAWGRAMKKASLRKATPARRPAHGATVATAADSDLDSSADPARAPRASKHAWVDPWAEN